MDSDSWISSRISNSSRRYYSRSDLFVGGNDDAEPGGDDLRAEYLCPFCAEDYDVVSLCCHIDEEHPLQANTGVCPACGEKVGMDLVEHITTQHSKFFKVPRKRRVVRKGVSNSTLFRKELREGALHSLLGGSSTNSESDTLLSSFIFNPVLGNEAVSEQSSSSIEASPVKDSSKNDFVERKPQQVQMSDEDRIEKTRRLNFVQGLLMSTILDDKL
ncbi:unnamed protein product [Vicia faba]|uniref:Uncharacterized protein n=1 Tax=Vicia faba TaxID=3906 RepID=A0AAV0YW73_VICFA|nr:unnamed protein product [Vicia faba]